jgi:hypothetical protein
MINKQPRVYDPEYLKARGFFSQRTRGKLCERDVIAKALTEHEKLAGLREMCGFHNLVLVHQRIIGDACLLGTV